MEYRKEKVLQQRRKGLYMYPERCCHLPTFYMYCATLSHRPLAPLWCLRNICIRFSYNLFPRNKTVQNILVLHMQGHQTVPQYNCYKRKGPINSLGCKRCLHLRETIKSPTNSCRTISFTTANNNNVVQSHALLLYPLKGTFATFLQKTGKIDLEDKILGRGDSCDMWRSRGHEVMWLFIWSMEVFIRYYKSIRNWAVLVDGVYGVNRVDVILGLRSFYKARLLLHL